MKCMDFETYYKAPRPDHVPANRQEESALLGRARQYATACGDRWGWLLPHMSTENSARDLDAIRAALGEPRSATWVTPTAPTSARSTPRSSPTGSSGSSWTAWWTPGRSGTAPISSQDATFDRRHRDFLRWTARHNRVYRLGSTEKAVSFAWYAMRERLRTRPAAGVVGPSELDDVYTVGGYSDVIWPQLAKAFSAYVKKDETPLLLSAYREHAPNDADDENNYAVYLECSVTTPPGRVTGPGGGPTRPELHAKAPS